MFQLNLIATNDNTFIILSKIESIKINRDDEDETMDKLKDDLVITVTTVSGKTYDISMRHQQNIFSNYPIPRELIEVRTTIIQNWINLANRSMYEATR